jgi:predicted acyl esterase
MLLVGNQTKGCTTSMALHIIDVAPKGGEVMARTSTVRASGIAPGQRNLNGPQTTGREYRSLSEPEYGMRRDDDVPVPMRDGVRLLAVHRPDSDGLFPALIAASPYPRQIQDLGAPMGLIEAGASDFFVPRGYVHTTGCVSDVTAGWRRTSVREVDESASRPDAPVLRCRTAEAVPPREPVNYRIPLVPNARRFAAGHCIRLVLTSDDQSKGAPAIMEFRHAAVGTRTTNTISSASRLLFPSSTNQTEG